MLKKFGLLMLFLTLGCLPALASTVGADSGPPVLFADPSVLDGSGFGTGIAPNHNTYTISDSAPYTITFNETQSDAFGSFYFRISNVEGKTVTFKWKDKNVSTDSVVYSYSRPLNIFYPGDAIFANGDIVDDRIPYEVSAEGVNDEPRTYTLTHTFKEDVAYVCYTPIHTSTQVEHLIDEIKDSPYVEVERLTESHFYHIPMDMITITDPGSSVPLNDRKGVFMMGRECAYETSTLAMAKTIRFLLSDNPFAAELREQFVFYIIPIVSQDGAHIGTANYLIDTDNPYWYGVNTIYLATLWSQARGAYPELDAIKDVVTDLKAKGRDLSLLHSYHCTSYWKSFIREQYTDDTAGLASFYWDTLLGKYWNHYVSITGKNQELIPTKVQKVFYDQYPNMLTGSSHSDFLFPADYFNKGGAIFRTNDDLYLDGELLLRAIGSFYGVTGYDDAEPFLFSGAVLKNNVREGQDVTYRVIYRDLDGAGPVGDVKVWIDGTPHIMEKDASMNDYTKGVFYYYTEPLMAEVDGFYFTASNAYGERRVPEYVNVEYPGPFISATTEAKLDVLEYTIKDGDSAGQTIPVSDFTPTDFGGTYDILLPFGTKNIELFAKANALTSAMTTNPAGTASNGGQKVVLPVTLGQTKTVVVVTKDTGGTLNVYTVNFNVMSHLPSQTADRVFYWGKEIGRDDCDGKTLTLGTTFPAAGGGAYSYTTDGMTIKDVGAYSQWRYSSNDFAGKNVAFTFKTKLTNAPNAANGFGYEWRFNFPGNPTFLSFGKDGAIYAVGSSWQDAGVRWLQNEWITTEVFLEPNAENPAAGRMTFIFKGNMTNAAGQPITEANYVINNYNIPLSGWTQYFICAIPTGNNPTAPPIIFDDMLWCYFAAGSNTPAEIMSVTPDAAAGKVTVNLNRPGQDGAMLVVAVYDGNKLIGVKTETITQSGDITANISIPSNTDTVKAVVWEGGNTMRPLCPSKAVGWNGSAWTAK